MASQKNSYEMKAKGTVPTRASESESTYPTRPPGLENTSDIANMDQKKNQSSTSVAQIDDMYSRFQKDMTDYRNSRYIAPNSNPNTSPNPSQDYNPYKKEDDADADADVDGEEVEAKTPLVGVHIVDASSSSTNLSRNRSSKSSKSIKGKIQGKPIRKDSADEEETASGSGSPTQPQRPGPGNELDQEYQLYKRRWIGVVALVIISIPISFTLETIRRLFTDLFYLYLPSPTIPSHPILCIPCIPYRSSSTSSKDVTGSGSDPSQIP
jgi:hypothetical protein